MRAWQVVRTITLAEPHHCLGMQFVFYEIAEKYFCDQASVAQVHGKW